MIKGATERWVEVEGVLPAHYGNELCCNIFPNFRAFQEWNVTTNRDYNTHPDCVKVESAVFTKTQQAVKLYRLTRMEYVGYLLPQEKS